jgi:hypothetical protein
MSKRKAKAGRGKKTVRRESKSRSENEMRSRGIGSAEESVEKSKTISKEPMDMARVRKDISNMMGNSASEIAAGMINAALAGELAPAKYLFEMAGLYPPAEEIEATNPEGNSLAQILLKKMGLPIEPVIKDASAS